MPTPIEVKVRPLEPSDAKSLFAAVRASLPELSYWMPWCHQAYSLDESNAWIAYCQQAWSAGKEFPLGVFDAVSGEVVGGTGVNQINKLYRIGNVGYWVATPQTGRGVAKAAARKAVELGFGELGLTRIEIVALTHNEASQRVARSIGATQECLARNRLYFHGKPHDAYVFSVVPADLSASLLEAPQ